MRFVHAGSGDFRSGRTADRMPPVALDGLVPLNTPVTCAFGEGTVLRNGRIVYYWPAGVVMHCLRPPANGSQSLTYKLPLTPLLAGSPEAEPVAAADHD